MFVDVSGSTRLYADRGDTIALSIAVRVLRLMEEGVVSRQGWVIKTLGDGLLAVFSTPEDAVAAGGKILADVRDRLGHEGIRVRAGIHHGRTRTVGNDIFGDTVNVTARLAELAKADEILLSGEVHEELPGERRASARFVEEVEVRGHPVRVRVYQFLWHEEDVTVGLAPRRRPRPPRLDLRFEDIEIEVSPAKPLVTIGRGAECDVVVQDHAVSRHHADVALHGAGFALRDRSTNGTYVVLDGGETSRVFREEISLTGSGRILAGSETTEPILFRVRAG